jgi:delta 1-pyrroline-5-carboxylate dehydrogenase
MIDEQEYKAGGKHKFSDKPGEVYMTGGEFDHGTNKKALIDEETGEKEAELTGGEAMVADGDNMLVFNPEQQNTIEGLVNKGDSKGLMKAMKRLMKQFNKDNV